MAWEGIVGALDAARANEQQLVETEPMMKAFLEQKDRLARRIFTKAGLDNTSALQATDDFFISKQPNVSGDTSAPIIGQHMSSSLEQKKIELHYTKEAIDVLARLGFDPNFGARPVKRVIQQLVENEIAMGVLRGDFKEDEAVLVDADVNSDLPPHKRLRMRKLLSDSSIEAMVANN